MPGFWERVFGRSNADSPTKRSGSKAKERLQFILVHDRIHLSPERMEQMKSEILEVISKYVDVDGNNVDIALQKRERNSMLVAEIPFTKPTMVDDDEVDFTPKTRPGDPSSLTQDDA